MLRSLWNTWLRPSAANIRRRAGRVRLILEVLDDRLAPAVFNVNSFLDTDAVNLITGQDASGNVSLRSAIEAANATAGSSTINLAAGDYNLVSHFASPGPLADLTIGGNLTIAGAGASQTTVDAGGVGRILQIANQSVVTVAGVKITNGLAVDQGGAISNAGNLTLMNDTLTVNQVAADAGANAKGGAIFNTSGGTLTLTGSTQVTQSTATAGAGASGSAGSGGTSSGQGGSSGTPGIAGAQALGGAIYNDGGAVNILGSTLSGNTAYGGGGGSGGDGGAGFANPNGDNSSLAGPGGTGGAGGQALGGSIYNNGGTITVTNSSISGFAQAGNAGAGGAGGSGGGAGGNGGTGGQAAGGGIYNAGAGSLIMQNTSANSVSGTLGGGVGGDGGSGGAGGTNSGAGGNGGNAGAGGTAQGAALFNDVGSIHDIGGSMVGTAFGGNGGNGGDGATGGDAATTPGTSGSGGAGGNGRGGAPGGMSAGGAVFNNAGTVTIQNATISGLADSQDFVTSGNGGQGGNGGAGDTADVTSSGGSAGQGGDGGEGSLGAGGGIYNAGGTLNVSQSTFTKAFAYGGMGGVAGASGIGGAGRHQGGPASAAGNGGAGGDARGGALAVFGGNVTLTGNTFDDSIVSGGTGNTGGSGGSSGAADAGGGTGQTGGSGGAGGNAFGGALDLVAGNVGITNCTFANYFGLGADVANGGNAGQGGLGGGFNPNQTPGKGGNGGVGGNGQGGAIHVGGGALTFTNVTISGNQATGGQGSTGGAGGTSAAANGSTGANGHGQAGGVYAGGGTNQVVNTILAGNSADPGSPNVVGLFVSAGYNLVGDATGSSGFEMTGDQVGTPSSPIDPKLGPLQNNGGPTFTMALLTGSPAFNAGTTNDNAPTTDQRGSPRDGQPDIGAYEVEGFNASSSVLQVNAGQTIRAVNNQVLGVNLAWWDSSLNTPQTAALVQAAGLTMFRFPGGSSADTWHFTVGPTYNGEGTTPSMASFISSVNGTGLVTLNYGTGSPQEAAALLAYLDGAVSNNTTIGMGQQWKTSTSTWVQLDWKTAGYWAGLRAASPLPTDDGLNFLRIGHSAPFGFQYFEVGNEIYGSWETDEHGQGGDTGLAHDPATYVKFAKQFAALAASIDPIISIGEVTGSVSYDNNWTANVLAQDVSQGFTPGFLSDHTYMQAPGSESDAFLLYDTVADTAAANNGSPFDWAQRAADYRALLNQVLGTSASKVQLFETEFNSVYANPGKQTTSLVNGLFVADSIGSILETEYDALDFWDLRNGWDATENNSSSLYGWRQGGDYGLLGGSEGTAPATGTYVPYPTYFAEELLSKMVHNGDTVVQASSNDPNLDVFAVMQADGHLDLLVINKNATTDLTGKFQIAGFTPTAQAQVWQYGKSQDTAQSQSSDGASALAQFTANLTLNGSNFSYLFPSYSMTVLDLATKSTTTTTVTASTGTITYGQTVTFTAQVAAGSGVPTGNVEFFDLTTGADLGPGTLQTSASNSATWSLTTLPTQLKVSTAGANSIEAVYTPSGNFLGGAGILAGGETVLPRGLTLTAATNTKAYDGTMSAAATPTFVGLAGTDTLSGLAEAYSDANVGSSKTLSVSSFTVNDGNNGHNYAVTLVNVATGSITAGPFSKFVINVSGGNTFVAGTSFVMTAQATDQFGNPIVNYSGPATITASAAPPDPKGNLPLTTTLNAGGFGVFLVTLKTTGTYTLNVSAGSFSGNNPIVTVLPASATSFTIAADSSAITGNQASFTIRALDPYGNLASGYGGLVHFSSSDAGAVLPPDTMLSGGAGTFNFTLKKAGNQTITATDTQSTNPTITGTSNAIVVRGLTVINFTPTPDGFSATFNKPFLPADLALYGPNSKTGADVTMTGDNGVGPIHGSLLLDSTNQILTFKATSSYLSLLNKVQSGTTSVVLPDASYTITLVSGAAGQGFLDALGAGLDGGNDAGHANFVTTFSTHYQANASAVLGIPDFARGSDANTPIEVPNKSSAGIPITLYNASNVTNVSFTLTYNSTLLNVTGALGGAGSNATDPGGTFVLNANSGGVATFTFHDATPQSGTVILGDITSVVPTSAKNQYQVKELLRLGNIVIDSGAGAVAADGIHVNVYLGDVNADHNIDGLDKLAMDNIAQGRTNGFSPFPLLDPVVVGDVAGDLQVDAGDVSTVDSYQALLAPAQIPVPPGLSGITSPQGADPTLSLGEPWDVSPRVNTPLTVSILLDDPHPAGSSGLTSATIALAYDPTVLAVKPGDITLGSIPTQGTDWQISSMIDATKGQIVIQIYSATPVTATQPGSLVNIAFTLQTGERRGLNPPVPTATTVSLVDSATPNGQYFSTVLADALSAMILSPGADRLTIQTGINPLPSVHAIAPLSKDSSLPLESAAARPGLKYSETPDPEITDKYTANDSPSQPMESLLDAPPMLIGVQPFPGSLANEILPRQPATELFFKMLANETDHSERAEPYEPTKIFPHTAFNKALGLLVDQDWDIRD